MSDDPGADPLAPIDGRPDAPARPADTADAPRLALRSPLEVFLWIFVTRLMALLSAGRAQPAGDSAGGNATASATPPTDPTHVDRVTASRHPADGRRSDRTRAASADDGRGDRTGTSPGADRSGTSNTRAITLTTVTAVAAGAATFAAGRRRGAR